jgi:ATP-binding cassette subfamily B protein
VTAVSGSASPDGRTPAATAPALDARLAPLLWPAERRDDVARALAVAARIARPAAPEWFQLPHDELARSDAWAARAPAFFQLEAGPGAPGGAVGGFVAVVAHEGAMVRVLGPDGGVTRLPAEVVAGSLRAASEGRVSTGVDGVVARSGLAPARAPSVRAALVSAALEGEPAVEGWRVRPRSGSLAAAFRDAGVLRRLALTSLAYGAQLALLVLAWWMVGARAAAGAGAPGAGAWIAVLAGFVAAHAAASWSAGRLAIDSGRVLRARLIDGLLALDTEPLRAEGIGQLLGRVMETEAVESLSLGGGLLGVAGIFELTTGVVILALGARASSELALLALVLTVGGVLAARLRRALDRWSAQRLALTHDLVETMAGHRTLVAQQPPELRHRGEDEALAAYEAAGAALDRASAALAALVPRGWLLAGVAALAPSLAAPNVGAGLVATTLGGVLFVYSALRKLTQAFPALATAAIAWRQVEPLFAGAARADWAPARSAPAAPARDGARSAAGEGALAAAGEGGPAPALVAARDLGFRYPDRAAPALVGCSLEIRRGDRVLLEGPSGGGKSTLASLVAGLRAPDAGALALDGVDQGELGLPRWRERVGVVPQFHENHVFSASVLFNLLLGRAWPPRREDVAAAEAVCRDLDLGGLLARMPSGLEQLVGESGWQLSHGERSRLFIARALLQRLDLRVLDESFAALDPETLERVLDCVLARADTLLVIAHP